MDVSILLRRAFLFGLYKGHTFALQKRVTLIKKIITMEKVLIVLAHPNYEASNSNRALLEALPKDVQLTIHNIYEAYPDGQIDVEREQELLLDHDRIIIQFPTQWFNVPSLLKFWLDEVLTYGWAFGVEQGALVGKKMGIVTTTGGVKEPYVKDSHYGFTVEEFLLPVIATIKYIDANYIGFVALNNAYGPTEQEVSEAVKQYVELLKK